MEKAFRDSVTRGDVERLRELLADGADVNARDRYGQTGLMLAAHHGRVEAVRVLIERGARLDHTAKFGLSALMLAVIQGHVEIVRMLAEAGADLDLRGTGAAGFSGLSALDLATARQNEAMIATLTKTPR